MTIGERLKSAIKDKKLKLTEFAKLSKMPYRTLQAYTVDEVIPGGESLIKIHTTLGISIEWLLMGQGEMYQAETEPKSNNTNTNTLILTQHWLEKWWEEADDEHRTWLKVQLKRCFPEYAQWIEKHSEKE